MSVRCYNMIRRRQKAGGVVPQNVTPTALSLLPVKAGSERVVQISQLWFIMTQAE